MASIALISTLVGKNAMIAKCGVNRSFGHFLCEYFSTFLRQDHRVGSQGVCKTLNLEANATKPYYITTPIYYVNGLPHLGHAYTSVTADVLARFHRMAGHPVHFVTGTDEHGQKVQQSALAAGQTPQAFADEISAQFRSLTEALGCSNDDFIRTTEARHKVTAAKLWKALEASGQIYLGAYEGWYSVRDEAYYQESELVDGKAPSGAPVQWVREESYFFRLSQWTQPLLDFYEANPDFIAPRGCRNEVVAFVAQKGGLKDLSISRSTFSWGIPVPGNNEHVMYVWLDALANYLSAIEYAKSDSSHSGSPFERFWPASLHVIGKDILRFHCIYWPAFLLAAGLAPPKRVFAHGWWTKDGEKMSKSLGNVLDPRALLAVHGRDPLRYFLVSEIPFGGNGDFSHSAFVNRFNSDLANDVGNLTQRAITLIHKHCHGRVPQPGTVAVPDSPQSLQAAALEAEDRALLDACDAAMHACIAHASNQGLKAYCETIISVSRLGNRYIDVQAPWALQKALKLERMQSVLYTLVELLRRLAILLGPVVPDGSKAMLAQLGATDPSLQTLESIQSQPIRPGTPVGQARPVFPRLELVTDSAASSNSTVPAKEKSSSTSCAASMPNSLSARLSAELEEVHVQSTLQTLAAEISAAGDVVRALKASGASKAALSPAVERLLVLKRLYENKNR